MNLLKKTPLSHEEGQFVIKATEALVKNNLSSHPYRLQLVRYIVDFFQCCLRYAAKKRQQIIYAYNDQEQ